MITRTAPAAAALLVKGAHVLDPASGADGLHDLLIVNGRVAALAKPGALASRAKSLNAVSLDASGKYLSPGFVDLNCAIHEPGNEGVENFTSGSAAAAAGGFTTLLVKPLTEPVHDNAFMTDFIRRRAEEKSKVRIVPMGALTVGREGAKLAEVGSMARAGVRAVGDGRGHADSYLLRKGLEYTQAFNLPVFSFPEDRILAGQGMMNEGWNSNRLGLRGIPPAAEEAYFTLTSDAIATYDANFKVFPPLRDEEDRAAVIEALADGTLDLIASAHRPQSRASKEQAFEHATAGMIGLETAFLLTLALVEKGKLSLLRMVELLSLAPARVLGLEAEIGSLKEGAWGDFVLFNRTEKTELQPANLRSASRNTPFLGQVFAGKIFATYVGGTLVHSHDSKEAN
ncbi:MAG: dihydroorotase [Proteobacteria bacterium]|nr:MAG: dihydroorotase [Pseudomonadota bacterium]